MNIEIKRIVHKLYIYMMSPITHVDTMAMCWCRNSAHNSSFSSSSTSFSLTSLPDVFSYLQHILAFVIPWGIWGVTQYRYCYEVVFFYKWFVHYSQLLPVACFHNYNTKWCWTLLEVHVYMSCQVYWHNLLYFFMDKVHYSWQYSNSNKI